MSTVPQYETKDLYPNTNCLSSSQFLRYEESPQDFYVEYVLGIKSEPTTAMQMGSIFAELHRDREFDFKTAMRECKAPARITELMERAIHSFPPIPSEIALKCEHNGWQFRATLDGFVEEDGVIVENKTGQTEWTQERFNFSDQITFQAWVYYKKYGVLPRRIICNWLDFRARSTQPLRTFKTSRTKKALMLFEKRVDAVIENLEVGNFTQQIYG